MNSLRIAAFLLTLLAISTPVFAQVDTREQIQVTGAAELKVVPNEFVLRATLESFGKDLDDASRDNDNLVSQVSKKLGKLGIERKYVVTDDISVTSVTEGYRERRTFKRLGFIVRREVMVVLHDARKIESSMRVLFEAGVNHLSMTSSHTDISNLVEKAQRDAAASARKKAGDLSTALGRKLGRAVTISEASGGGRQASNFVYSANTPELSDSLSLGKMRINAAVNVTFLLE